MNDRFQLPSELNIYTAVETRDALAAWIAQQQTKGTHDTLCVSAISVNEVDGAGMQIMAALANSGEPWRLVDASCPFMDACKALGLAHWLGSLQPGASGEAP